jgi:hypothetical protein
MSKNDHLALPKAELETLLSELKLYRTLRKKLGDRGKRVFEAGRSGEKTLKIEYFPNFSKTDVEKNGGGGVRKKLFGRIPRRMEGKFRLEGRYSRFLRRRNGRPFVLPRRTHSRYSPYLTKQHVYQRSRPHYFRHRIEDRFR